jgi:hypothetical protein
MTVPVPIPTGTASNPFVPTAAFEGTHTFLAKVPSDGSGQLLGVFGKVATVGVSIGRVVVLPAVLLVFFVKRKRKNIEEPEETLKKHRKL